MIGRPKISTDDVALTLYWRAHIQGWLRSELSIRDYCLVHGIARRNFHRWRKELKYRDMVLERRALKRRKRGIGTKKPNLEAAKKGVVLPEPCVPKLKRSRRYFADAVKLHIVEETCKAGMSVSEIARRYNVPSAIIFRWRDELGVRPRREAKLMPVELLDGLGEVQIGGSASADQPLPLAVELQEGHVEIELRGGQRVRFDRNTDTEIVRRVIAALEGPSP